MGKEDEHNLPSTFVDVQGANHSAGINDGRCLSCSCWFLKLVSLRCVFVLALGFGVFLSAVFWLPFFRFRHHEHPDLEYGGHDIVASFVLRKPASFLQDYIMQLEDDIFDEISFTSTKVEIISLEASAYQNITKVVFAVESDVTMRSLIKASFLSMVTRQSPLHLTESLFGDPYEFDVLKFRGGITVSPEQKVFLMQNVQIFFNFTLNFSIDEILLNFEKLRTQLNTGLHLTPYENLYISLTSLRGSTVAPPTTVESQVLLAVGINPSQSRLKQLAQTITGSHSKNLGLNNTVFGHVKQVSLSSLLQRSLGGGTHGPSSSPSPSPLPSAHHHRRHHYHHHHEAITAPIISPSPASAPFPAPGPVGKKSKAPPPPPACPYDRHPSWKHNGHPLVAPSYSPWPSPTQLRPRRKNSPPPKQAPLHWASPPGGGHDHHSHPPLRSVSRGRPSNVMPIASSPSPSPSSAGIVSSHIRVLLLAIFAQTLL